jgi:hypothetical protein
LGDFFLTYDEGESYFRRFVYVNVILYVVFGIVIVSAFVLFMFDIIILILIALIGGVASLACILLFILKNPPAEYDEETLDHLLEQSEEPQV